MTISFYVSPIDGEAIHQIIDQLVGIFRGTRGEVGLFGAGENAAVPQDLLYLPPVSPNTAWFA
jgi:hypothetical protein